MEVKGFKQDSPLFEYKTWNASTVTTPQDQRLYPYGIIGDRRVCSTVQDTGTAARQSSTTPTFIPATQYQNTTRQTKTSTPCSERIQLPRNKHTVLQQSEDIEDEVWAKMPAPDERTYQDAVHKETAQKIARNLETERERLKRAEFKRAVKARVDELKRGE